MTADRTAARPDDLERYRRVATDAAEDLLAKARQLDAALNAFLFSATDRAFTSGVATGEGLGDALVGNARTGAELGEWVGRIGQAFRDADASGLVAPSGASGVVEMDTDALAWMALTPGERRALLAEAEALAAEALEGFGSVAELRRHAEALELIGSHPLAAAVYVHALGSVAVASIPNGIAELLRRRSDHHDPGVVQARMWELVEPFGVTLAAATRSATFDEAFTTTLADHVAEGRAGTAGVLLRFGEFDDRFLVELGRAVGRLAELPPYQRLAAPASGDWGVWADPLVAVPDALARHPGAAADLLGDLNEPAAGTFYAARMWDPHPQPGVDAPLDGGAALGRLYQSAADELHRQGRNADAAWLTVRVLDAPLTHLPANPNPHLLRSAVGVLTGHHLHDLHESAFLPRSMKPGDGELAGGVVIDGVKYTALELRALLRLVNRDGAAADVLFGPSGIAGYQAAMVSSDAMHPAPDGDTGKRVGAFLYVQSEAYREELEVSAEQAAALRNRALGAVGIGLALLPGVIENSASVVLDEVAPGAPPSPLERSNAAEVFREELRAAGRGLLASAHRDAGLLGPDDEVVRRMEAAATESGATERAVRADDGTAVRKPVEEPIFFDDRGTLVDFGGMNSAQRAAVSLWAEREGERSAALQRDLDGFDAEFRS